MITPKKVCSERSVPEITSLLKHNEISKNTFFAKKSCSRKRLLRFHMESSIDLLFPKISRRSQVSRRDFCFTNQNLIKNIVKVQNQGGNI